MAEALEAIEDGALDEGTLEELAERVGTTSRTLRRAFDAEVGATPQAIASSRRLALAKRLLHDTRLPMIDVAYASGFGSLRRFNAAFVACFGVPPSRLRREREDDEAARTIVARLVDALGAKIEPACFGIERLFPTAGAVVAAGPPALRALGLPLARAEALHAVAALAANGGLAGTSADVRARLLAIRGIGPFTAGYVAMRGLADPDALPEGDLVVARAFGVAPGALARRMETVRPFRAYATVHVYSAALHGAPSP